MRPIPSFPLLSALLMASAQGAGAQAIARSDLATVPVSDVAALPGVASGALRGAMDAQGLFASAALMRGGAVLPPHSHPDTRLTVVVEGTMYLGEGDSFDKGALVACPAGSAAVTPADNVHVMAAPDGDVRAMEVGVGSTASVFVGAP